MIFMKEFLMENIEGVLLRVVEDREGVNWDWLKRCEPFVGTWTPADHVYFLHRSEDVRQEHYVTIARSNAYGGAVRLTSPSISNHKKLNSTRSLTNATR